MTLAPEPRPDCTRNLAIWTTEDGTRGQMCCCPDCTEGREIALELSKEATG